MSNEENQDRERALRERIVILMRANAQATRKPLPSSELQRLKGAAGRLDQMLQAAEEADRQALRTAAARLDQILNDLQKGKDVGSNLKRRT